MTRKKPRGDWPSRLPPPVQITTRPAFKELVARLSDQPIIAVDTESNSLYAYQEQVCLIQISTPDTDYVVDPLADLDISALGPWFANSNVEKVFHAAEYDVMCLKRDYGFRFANLFDTMWAARILGWPRVGLADVLKEHFGVRTNKRYQRYNWGKRPLGPKPLAYASRDTHYLLDLRQIQADALARQGRLEEAREVFDQVAASEAACHTFDPDDFWRIKGTRDLSRREQAILRELFIWREKEAERQNRPPFKVLNNNVLVALAHARPDTRNALFNVNRLKAHQVRRYGSKLLRAISQGMQNPLPRRPRRTERHTEEEVERFQALRTWRKQVAKERGVDPDVVLGNAVLWALAESRPATTAEMKDIEGLGPWKRKTYAEAVLQVLDNLE